MSKWWSFIKNKKNKCYSIKLVFKYFKTTNKISLSLSHTRTHNIHTYTSYSMKQAWEKKWFCWFPLKNWRNLVKQLKESMLKYCIIMTLDICNAFNLARWEALNGLSVLWCLTKIVAYKNFMTPLGLVLAENKETQL